MVFAIIFQSVSSITTSLENVSIEPTYIDVTWMNRIIEKSIAKTGFPKPEGSVSNDH
jgi:hypothetical protein